MAKVTTAPATITVTAINSQSPRSISVLNCMPLGAGENGERFLFTPAREPNLVEPVNHDFVITVHEWSRGQVAIFAIFKII